MNICRMSFIAIVFYLTLNPAFSHAGPIDSNSEAPSYREGTLTLPRVDTDEQSGLYQNAIFQFDPTTNAWHLQAFETTPAIDIFLVDEDGVEVIMTDTLPVQVFLKIAVSFSDACFELGTVNQRLIANHFEIVVHVASTIPRDGSVACAAVLTKFEKIVPLQVYDLSAGNYEYQVNGEKTGTFVLTKDNRL
ncbi:MAG: hypothetical protein LZF61_00165 [Nitrosomonas sp.]|nr:MAG: hypothetical protein LZF61_00165 [Nitrosomonas sp.]